MVRYEDHSAEEIRLKYGPHRRSRQGDGRSLAAAIFLLLGIVVLLAGLIRVVRVLTKDPVAELQSLTAADAAPSEPGFVEGSVQPTDAPESPAPTLGPEGEQRIVETKPHYVQSGEEDYRLVLVNAWNPLEPSFAPPEFTQLRNEQSVDKRCYPDLQAMMDACRAAGHQPLICSSFRSYAKQQELYNTKVNTLIAGGKGEDEAKTEAARLVAAPGTSEHQLGLACDIVDANRQILETEQEGTATQNWLLTHSYEYGFVLRFPKGKEDATGVAYEPWHYRYVGREAAREMHMSGDCLEEYLAAKAGWDGTAVQNTPAAGPAPTGVEGAAYLKERFGAFPLRLQHMEGQELYAFELRENGEASRLWTTSNRQESTDALAWDFASGVLTIRGAWEETLELRDADGLFVSHRDTRAYRVFPADPADLPPGSGAETLEQRFGAFPTKFMCTPQGGDLYDFELKRDGSAERSVTTDFGARVETQDQVTWAFGNGVLVLHGESDESFQLDETTGRFVSLTDGKEYRPVSKE